VCCQHHTTYRTPAQWQPIAPCQTSREPFGSCCASQALAGHRPSPIPQASTAWRDSRTSQPCQWDAHPAKQVQAAGRASRTRAAPQPRRMCDTAASPWPRPARLEARAQRMPNHGCGRKRRLRHARAAQAAFFAAPAEGAAAAACTRRKRLPALLAPTAASAAHTAAARSTNPASRRAVSGPRARALLSSRGRAKPALACHVRWGIRNHLWHAKSAPYTCARGARGAAGRREQGGRTQRQLERACQALREQRPRARIRMRRRRGGEQPPGVPCRLRAAPVIRDACGGSEPLRHPALLTAAACLPL